jgi:hypothetical protein
VYGGGAASLHWNPNLEPDLAGYRLYRGTSPGFVPGPGNLVSAQADTGYVDAAGSPQYYKLSAIDTHGNESGFTLLLPVGSLDVQGVSLPHELALERPGPNPATGPVALRFALPREARVSLAIYDPVGRRVRSVADGVQAAGEHSVPWDLRDERGAPLSAGLYFVRLEAEGRRFVQRLAVVR